MTTATAPEPTDTSAPAGDAGATDAAQDTTSTEGTAKDASADSGKTLISKVATQESAKSASFELALPSDSPLDPAVLPRLTDLAQKAGVTDAASAQAIVDLLHGEVTAIRDATKTAFAKGGSEWSAMVRTMEAQALADPDLGNGDPARLHTAVADVQQVVAKYGPQGFTDFLDESGLGSDPRFLKFAKALHTAMREDRMVAGGPPAEKPKTAAQKMYPNLPSKGG